MPDTAAECPATWVDDWGKDHACNEDAGHAGGHECGCGARLPKWLLDRVNAALADLDSITAPHRRGVSHRDECGTCNEIEAVKVLIAHTRTDITGCHCGWGSHAGNLGQSHALHVWRELQRAVLPDHDARVRADERARVAGAIPGWAHEQEISGYADRWWLKCIWCNDSIKAMRDGDCLEDILTAARDHHRTCAHRLAARQHATTAEGDHHV